MPRLFVALELPPVAIDGLALLRPQARSGVRLVDPRQMHLTLHYLGEADVERTASLLAGVCAPPIEVRIDHLGQFESTDGAVTLWAGAARSDDLLQLHRALSTALAPAGFQPEARPYTPHVTLARCATGEGAEVAAEFLTQPAWSLPRFIAAAFGLYSSTFVEETPRYRCEHLFPLRDPLSSD